MDISNMPSNLTLRMFDFCKDCDRFDTDDITYYIGNTEYHTILCSHIDACGRMKNKMEGKDNAE